MKREERAAVELMISPKRPKLSEYLAAGNQFQIAFARAVGAIAGSYGAITVAEFSAISDIARQAGGSPLVNAVFMHSVEQATSVDVAFSQLAKCSSSLDMSERLTAFRLAFPVLVVQGEQARPLARKLAKALGLTPAVSATDIDELPVEDERGIIESIGDQARGLFKSKDVTKTVIDFAQQFGEPSLIKNARDFGRGSLTIEQLRSSTLSTIERVERDIISYREQEALAGAADSALIGMIQNAREVERQVEQRLALVCARIQFERKAFRDGVEDAIHDAGNAIELSLSGRLRTDDWRNKDAWEDYAHNSAGREIEARLNRLLDRHEQALKFLKEDLRMFQNDLNLVFSSIAERQHHTAYAKLVPSMRLSTRALNVADSAATATLATGSIAAAGAGAALYFLGAAAALPVVAPAAPIIAGGIALAGLYKWLTNPEKRKHEEIKDKRKAIEQALRARFNEAEASFNSQLDQLASEFHASAEVLLTPIILNAEAAEQVTGMRQRLAERAITRCQSAIKQLTRELLQNRVES